MDDLEAEVAAVAAHIAKLHRTLPLQRAVDAAFDRLAPLLKIGVPLGRLADELTKAGVTRRDGTPMTASDIGRPTSRARVKAARAERQNSATPGTAAKPPASLPAAPAEAPEEDLQRGGVMSTIAKLLQKGNEGTK